MEVSGASFWTGDSSCASELERVLRFLESGGMMEIVFDVLDEGYSNQKRMI